MSEKIVNPACLRNQQPILQALSPWLSAPGPLLELASGTGQHGVHMAQALPHIQWQLSEQASHVALSIPWQQSANLTNLQSCIHLDVNQPSWPVKAARFQYGYCANLLHFVSEPTLAAIFKGMHQALIKGGLFFCYGPINEGGFTSEGNVALDAWLKREVNPQAGIKEQALLEHCAHKNGFCFKEKIILPANNVILIFEKTV